VNLPEEWTTRPVAGKRTSAVSYVLQDLRTAITSQALTVGDRLPSESALSARYSVSRAVVREVLRSLEATGLTMTRTGKGTFVVASHPAELVFEGYSAMDLMEARPSIEVPAAGLAALRRTEAHLDALHQLAARMEAEHDNAVWTRLDASFHLTIAQASGNPVYADVLASIASALRGQSEMLNVEHDRRSASLAEHRSIAVGIARGSAVEAEDAMRFHLAEVHDALAISLTSTPAPAPANQTGRH